MKLPMLTHLQAATLDPCSLTREAYERARETWLCSGCGAPRPGVTSVDVRLQELPRKDLLTFVSGCGVPIARRHLLQELAGEALETDLWLGRVLGADDEEQTEWVTFRGRHPLIVRGSRNVSHRVCGECGRNVYFAMGSRYLCPPPPGGIKVFETDLLGLAVFGQVITRRPWPSIALETLPIREHAADGLPDELSWRIEPNARHRD